MTTLIDIDDPWEKEWSRAKFEDGQRRPRRRRGPKLVRSNFEQLRAECMRAMRRRLARLLRAQRAARKEMGR